MRPLAFPLRVLTGLAAVAITACASNTERVPFTEALIDDYRLGTEHRQHLQYFLSDRITLTRSVGDNDRSVARGRLVTREDVREQALRVAKGTPGVVVGSGDGWLAVSFAPGSYLYFVSEPDRLPGYFHDDHVADRFYLYSPDADGDSGTVSVDGLPYTADSRSLRAFLLVDEDSLSRSDARAATLPGRWLVERR